MSGADLAKDKEKVDRTDEATVKASGPDKAGAEAAAKPAENPTIRQPSSERVLLARLFRYVRPHWQNLKKRSKNQADRQIFFASEL